MNMHRSLTTRAYSLFGAATTVIYMMAMFGVNNTLYSLGLSALERAITNCAAGTPVASALSHLSRLMSRRFSL